MQKQTQEMVSLFAKAKDEVKAQMKKDAKAALFEIAKDAPLQTAFMDMRNGGMWSATYEAIRESPNKKIEVLLPSGASVAIASEDLNAKFFGELYNACKKEQDALQDVKDISDKKRTVRFMVCFRYC